MKSFVIKICTSVALCTLLYHEAYAEMNLKFDKGRISNTLELFSKQIKAKILIDPMLIGDDRITLHLTVKTWDDGLAAIGKFIEEKYNKKHPADPRKVKITKVKGRYLIERAD